MPSWVRCIADALQYAHDNGVIHRDVKSSNILIQRPEPDNPAEFDSFGSPLLSDFGLALHLDGGVKLTQSGEAMETPAYASPELIRGQSHRCDHRTDVYSLGIVLYELLCDRLPFAGTMVKFNVFAGIDLLVEGRLLASGTTAQPIVFTSFRDDTGLDGVLGNGDDQDSNGNGPSNGNNGDWNAVQFLAGGTGSVLDHVQVRHGGSGALAALVASVPMILTNSVVRNSITSGVGFQTTNAVVTVSNNVII